MWPGRFVCQPPRLPRVTKPLDLEWDMTAVVAAGSLTWVSAVAWEWETEHDWNIHVAGKYVFFSKDPDILLEYCFYYVDVLCGGNYEGVCISYTLLKCNLWGKSHRDIMYKIYHFRDQWARLSIYSFHCVSLNAIVLFHILLYFDSISTYQTCVSHRKCSTALVFVWRREWR